MLCEYYTLHWDGTTLHMMQDNSVQGVLDAEQPNSPTAPWAVHSCLGDDNKIWCEVYRAPEKSGGIFCVKDFNDTLIIAHAPTNMAFVHGMHSFANMVSTSRYAADIFENADDFDD